MPIDRSLACLTLGARHEAALKRLRQMVGNGRDLASSGQLSGVFTPLESGLVHAAQEAGALTHIYRQLAQRYDEQARHVTELRSRLLLPAGVLLLALVVAVVKLVVGVLIIALFENSMARLRFCATSRVTWAGFGFAFLAFVSLLVA